MRIFLILNQPYPNGYALSKRFHLYAKGLIEHDHEVKILIPRPNDKIENGLNNNISGTYDNVEFKYFWKRTFRSNSFIMRRWHDFIGVFMTGIFFITNKPDIVITSTYSNNVYWYWRVITCFMSIKFIREKNEVDFFYHSALTNKQVKQAKNKNKWFDGFVFINQQLQNYTEKILEIYKPFIIVPILVIDTNNNDCVPSENTILYSGTYVDKKDGIITLIKAFSKLVRSNKNVKLLLTGSLERSPDCSIIKQTIKDYNLENNIRFTGYLNEPDLHQLMAGSTLLIVIKPDNRQNRYNFPTKLGEYLITGRPVLSTKVGSIGNLFHDNVNIFFTKFDVDSIAEKMQYIISNKTIANRVGTNGRKFALKEFNYYFQSKRMVEFFETLKSK